MWDFITANSEPLNTILNFLMLIVWGLYFQLLLNAHRHQRRAKILINRSAGHTLSANCVVSNLSVEPIYVEAIVIEIERDGKSLACSLSDLETLTKAPEADPRPYWFQGPLSTGEYLNLGSFENLLERAAADEESDGDAEFHISEINEFDLLVIATYGLDRTPVAASRAFRRDRGDTWRANQTKQIRSITRRRKLLRYLHETG